MHQWIHFRLHTFCRGGLTFNLTDKWLFHWSADWDSHSNDPICLVDSYTILLHWADHVCNRKRRKGDDGPGEVQGVGNIQHDMLKCGSCKAIVIFRTGQLIHLNTWTLPKVRGRKTTFPSVNFYCNEFIYVSSFANQQCTTDDKAHHIICNLLFVVCIVTSHARSLLCKHV